MKAKTINAIKRIIQVFVFFLIAYLVPALALSAEFEVNTTVDATDFAVDGKCLTSSGACSLRAAIQEANSMGEEATITFSSSITSSIALTITGTDEDAALDGDLDILTDINFVGNGVDTTVIDASGILERIFHIASSGATVTVSGIRLTGGGDSTAMEGGAILNDGGTLTISDCQFDSNESSSAGSAIYDVKGTLVIADSVFTRNTGDSGAITEVQGSIQITGSTITGNIANEMCAGVCLAFSTSASISQSTISSNISAGPGGALMAMLATVTISDSTISDNTSTLGGGIFTLASTWTISNSTISGNDSIMVVGGEINCTDGVDDDGDGLIDEDDKECMAGFGGGISESTDFTTAYSFSTYSTFTFTNSTISGNSAARSGGGLSLATGSTVYLNNATVTGNSASEYGGGIFSERLTTTSSTATVELRNSILAENSSLGSGVDCYGDISSNGYNLVGNEDDCSFSAVSTDLVGSLSAGTEVDPLLSTLTDNGGNADTHALQVGSPAIDGGDPSGCTDGASVLVTDQRGETRSMDGDLDGTAVCDIGAYEYSPYTSTEACDDGVDNDGDGDVDGDDSDCATVTVAEVCDDGVDNDGDGDVDDDDSDCATQTTAEVCDDGVDNDGDGDVDEADSECKKAASDTSGDVISEAFNFMLSGSFLSCSLTEVTTNRSSVKDLGLLFLFMNLMLFNILRRRAKKMIG